MVTVGDLVGRQTDLGDSDVQVVTHLRISIFEEELLIFFVVHMIL